MNVLFVKVFDSLILPIKSILQAAEGAENYNLADSLKLHVQSLNVLDDGLSFYYHIEFLPNIGADKDNTLTLDKRPL